MSISGIRFACTTTPRFSGKAKSNEPNLVQQAWAAGLGRFFSGKASSDTSPAQAAPKTDLIQAIRDANGGVLECEKPKKPHFMDALLKAAR
jgi:hypothetical protein